MAKLSRKKSFVPQVIHGQWFNGEPTLTFPNDDLPAGNTPVVRELPKS